LAMISHFTDCGIFPCTTETRKYSEGVAGLASTALPYPQSPARIKTPPENKLKDVRRSLRLNQA